MLETTQPQNRERIPQPKEKFLIGNLLDVTAGMPVQSMMRLAREYGPIFQLNIVGRNLIAVSGFDLVDELCDETRFDKKVWTPLRNVRSFAGDGLFTAETQEPNWHKAHSLLLPNFGMRAMRGYLPMMVDIAEQLVGKWNRLNADDEIDVAGDMTRLTLDTIGLCGFDYRFNSFYREDMHPFVDSMVRSLAEAMARGRRLPIEEKLAIGKHRQFQTDVDLMNSIVDRIIKERRESGEDLSTKKDLLSYMLTGVDKQSGEKLDDVNIRYQIITFLIAGHETTSGLLSFTLYELLHHPEVLKKAYEEVDRVLGQDLDVMPTFEQVNQLRYVSQILKETLRLWPTAPAFALYPYEETVIGGKYRVGPENELAVIIPMLHRDPVVWGENAEDFDPDRFSPELEPRIPANAYKPFGNGQRACIGRQFAMQEAILVLGMLLQRYEFIDHTNYEFKIRETLTLKPDDFKIKIRKRSASEGTISRSAIDAMPKIVASSQDQAGTLPEAPRHGTPLLVLYGSNMGMAEDLANRIGEDGERMGFASTVAELDAYVEQLPREGAVVIVSASYNGMPPDNAGQFYDWLRSNRLSEDALNGVHYTVFGCGNRDWASTFQAVPRFIDSQMAQFGARRFYPRGEGDAREDFDGQFEDWYRSLWGTLFRELHIEASAPETRENGPAYAFEVVATPQELPLAASLGARPMKVLVNRELQRREAGFSSGRSTRHLEVALPDDARYRAGWHLGVVPRNPAPLVERVAGRFHLGLETYLVLRKNDRRKTLLPLETPVSVASLLANYVELQDVATRKQIKVLADHTECPPEKRALLALCGDDAVSAEKYRQEVLTKRLSLIDLLEIFPACELPFNVYLELLPALRPRYYSISSSPLRDASRASITVAVVDAPARSGRGQYRGICTSYLQNLREGDYIHAFIQDTHSSFLLPDDPTTPLIMVGPGTGLAPFRGFLQERAVQRARGEKVGATLLFFGCRHPEQDFIYEDELKTSVADGIAELYPAFSRLAGQPKRYVQDLLREQKERVWEIIQQGATLYVCGDAGAMAPAVRLVFAEIYREMTGQSAEEAEQWLVALTDANRYQVDVWPA
jgi:cytochrome P450/NADPH-cytochrome P450 reductase